MEYQSRKRMQYLIGIDEDGRVVRKTRDSRPAFIIGIDEAGRGPLAGPVVVGGVGIRVKSPKSKVQNQNLKIFTGIRDSKRLSAAQRETWYKKISTDSHVQWAVASISPKVIDRINIVRAAERGALRVYQRLAGAGHVHALLDGGLFLPKYISQETIIKGDEKIPVIAAASIIAKVTRDRVMRRLHEKYPQYRFDLHKGYGTKLHRVLLAEYGYSEIHRKSFRLKARS